MKPGRFTNKVVLITGASSGIGRACAEAFAQQGASLVLGARQYVTLCEIAQEIEREHGVKAIAVSLDVTDGESCQAFVHQALITFNKIDVLINNAGISMRALFVDADVKVLKQLMEVNFWGTVNCTKFALPELLKSGGTLVGVSSIAGYKGLPGLSGYAASKFAMRGFLESVRIENARKGLHVLIASPGFTASNIRNAALNAQGETRGATWKEEEKMMTAEEVALVICQAVASHKKETVMTAQGKLTVFLSRFFPSWLDTLVYNTYKKEKNSLLQ